MMKSVSLKNLWNIWRNKRSFVYLLMGEFVKIIKLIIVINLLLFSSEEPTKTDLDVLNALGDTFIVDETKYPLVRDWLRAVKLLQSKSKEISLPYKFRIYTPKLKKFNSYQ